MANDYLTKLKQLSPSLQAKLSDDKFLAELDKIDEQYGVKAVLILLGLLQGEADYGGLNEKLKADYGFNDFLAAEVKSKFGALIQSLGADAIVSPPVPAVKLASNPITFSTSDEEEVEKYANLAIANKKDYAGEARGFISAFGWPDQDQVAAKRLENIIIARIRGVRDDLETRQALLKSKKVGGMEFTEIEADKLLALINNKPAPITVKPSGVPEDVAPLQSVEAEPAALPAVVPESAIAVVSEAKIAAPKTLAQPTFEMEDGLPVVKMPADIKNIPVVSADAADKLPEPVNDVIIKAEAKEILPEALPKAFIAEKRIPESVLNAKTAARPNLDDVKLEKKLMGPIEELEAMTIIDFRRLAADPQTGVNKIKEKIDLLEQDSFNQKVAGIAAWQKSEVSRFYRQLGQLSMSENKNIEDVIKERLISGKPTLSLDEFHAVMELNKQLRY